MRSDDAVIFLASVEMKVNVVTLGCAKNLVDSEKLLRQLKENGHTVIHDAGGSSDAVIINTCGFILDAKTESVDTILSFVEAKKKGRDQKAGSDGMSFAALQTVSQARNSRGGRFFRSQ